ncbi:hypothetical protein XENTR_v10009823 [Xenopus tropicalis]|uniref:Olfactory receptor n=1 Tax=Xenopus tropicalis TaxID=8364 RepID=A0A8J0R263_XENTR|nr:olfactory receptor 5AU1 [Xenopus tropicalis]KAE8619515.1 hypothetical protein XENTR_v10009823 [Xenopus tropicalis]|eukprot:XP_004913132.1 PREDICTED: olfactory receptor 5AU1-like [Xenopus tropicalis]
MQANQSRYFIFVFDGLTNNPTIERVLFIIFLLIYIFTILGNGGLIVLINKSPILHTPMYFFLKHLSFLDMCYTSVIIPRTLSDLLSKKKTITLFACVVQLYFYASLFISEVYLLSAMAYDRYVAICQPLLYYVMMQKEKCIILIAICFAIGFSDSLIHAMNTFSQVYCNNHHIAHFFCDMPPVLKLSCSDTSVTELLVFAVVGFNSFVCISVIVISYSYIFSTILTIQSAQGRLKAFTTCSSHLISVGTLFGTLMYMYLRPNSSYSNDQDKVVSVFYTMVIPMLNPVIYSFRNKDVQKAFVKLIRLKTGE